MLERELYGVFDGARVVIIGGLEFIGSSLARRLLVLGSDVSTIVCLAPAPTLLTSAGWRDS
jgi:hypothetical protein